FMRLGSLCVLSWIIVGCDNSGSTNDMSVQTLPIGSPCAADGPYTSVCGPKPPYFCDTDHPNGYCKTACHRDSDCPPGAVCAGAKAVAPGECHKSCTQATRATDCRLNEGYICKDGPGGKPDDANHDYCDMPEMMSDGGA